MHPRLSCDCRVPTSLRPIFGADADKDALYSEEVVCSALKAYAEREGLNLGDGTVKLDKCAPSYALNSGSNKVAVTGGGRNSQLIGVRII